VVQGTLDELSGDPEMIVDVSGPSSPSHSRPCFGCDVVLDGPPRLRCATASSPQNIAIVTNYLTSVGLSMTSLRTRASLEGALPGTDRR